jgi:hypothetical protein
MDQLMTPNLDPSGPETTQPEAKKPKDAEPFLPRAATDGELYAYLQAMEPDAIIIGGAPDEAADAKTSLQGRWFKNVEICQSEEDALHALKRQTTPTHTPLAIVLCTKDLPRVLGAALMAPRPVCLVSGPTPETPIWKKAGQALWQAKQTL